MSVSILPLSERLSNIRSPEKCPELAVFSGDGITGEQATSIADVLQISKSIVTLLLDRNSIKDKGAKELGDALKSNTSLQYLDISSNQITFEGAIAIFKGLKVNRTLTHLLFNHNQLVSTDNPARELWIGLQFNKVLQVLSLSDNRMTDKTLAALCKGLAANRSVVTLNIAGNAFTGQGMASDLLPGTSPNFEHTTSCTFATYCHHTNALEPPQSINTHCPLSLLRTNTLQLSSNPWLTRPFHLAFSAPSLTSLDISNNPWAPEAITCLSEALAANPSLIELRLCRLPSVTLQGSEYNQFLTNLGSNTSILQLNLAETPVRFSLCLVLSFFQLHSQCSNPSLCFPCCCRCSFLCLWRIWWQRIGRSRV